MKEKIQYQNIIPLPTKIFRAVSLIRNLNMSILWFVIYISKQKMKIKKLMV